MNTFDFLVNKNNNMGTGYDRYTWRLESEYSGLESKVKNGDLVSFANSDSQVGQPACVI